MNNAILPRGVRRALTTRNFGRRMYYLPQVDSTNRVAVELARAGEQHGTVVSTDFQTAGRGRGMRCWLSPPGVNLLFSVILRPREDCTQVLPITLSFALAVAERLSPHVGEQLSLHWPNDVYAATGKICGLLAETAVRGDRLAYAVVGVGVNVNMAVDDVRDHVDYPAASMASLTGGDHDRVRVFADVLDGLERAYDAFELDGFAGCCERYNGRLAWRGTRVRVQEGGDAVDGVLDSVRSDGGLVVVPRAGDPHAFFNGTVRAL